MARVRRGKRITPEDFERFRDQLCRFAVCEAFGLTRAETSRLVDQSEQALGLWRRKHAATLDEFRSFVSRLLSERHAAQARITASESPTEAAKPIETVAPSEYKDRAGLLLGEAIRAYEDDLKSSDPRVRRAAVRGLEAIQFGGKGKRGEEAGKKYRIIDVPSEEILAALKSLHRRHNLPAPTVSEPDAIVN